MGAAVATWFMLGYPIVGAVFGVVAIVSGIVNAKNENAKTENAMAQNVSAQNASAENVKDRAEDTE
jgi:hypothetical protein